MRAVITDFAAAIFGAFVRLSARLSAATADRILFRMQRDDQLSWSAPERGWTITRTSRTPLDFVRDTKSNADAHVFYDRFTSTAESPGEMKAAPHETRNSHQREPARNAGRDHRGRPALRTAG
jgi:hypothetical protein